MFTIGSQTRHMSVRTKNSSSPLAGENGGGGLSSSSRSHNNNTSRSALRPYNVSYPGKLTIWNTLIISLCYISSAIFSGVFLIILMVCALAKTCIGAIGKTFNHADNNNSQNATPRLSLSNKEKKLTLDLRYYIQLEGLDLIEHVITTSDGFRIILHRIIDPEEPEEKLDKRYPILLQHGLMQSSAAFCTSGHDSLGLYLFKSGYDVWLGNNRCGFHPRHRLYRYLNIHMWQWGINELGTKDIGAMLDFITDSTKASKVALAAHSQGTTQTFYALCKDSQPDMGNRLSSFSALSPAVYTGSILDRWYFKFIRYLPQHIYHVFFGHHAFIGLMAKFHVIMPEKLYTFFGYLMFNYLLGWDDRLWNPVYKDRQFLFSPTYVSAELMYWWLGKSGFASNGCIFDESAERWFDSDTFPPLGLFVPGRDTLVDPNALVTRLSSYEQFKIMKVFDLPSYSHLDVLWAADVIEKIGKPLNEFIWANVEDKENWNEPSLLH